MTIFLINILKVYLYSHQISAGSRWFYRNGRKHYYLCWCHRDVDSMRRPNCFLVVQVVKTHPGFLLALNYLKKKPLKAFCYKISEQINNHGIVCKRKSFCAYIKSSSFNRVCKCKANSQRRKGYKRQTKIHFTSS